MRRLPWAALGMVVISAGLIHAFVGCGSDNPPAIQASTDAAADGTGEGTDGATNDGGVGTSVNNNPECKVVGQGCASSGDCCTANCDPTAKTCSPSLTQCKPPNDACNAPNECCTGSCVDNKCSDKQCVPDKPTPGVCGVDGDCCSGICENGKCASLNPGGTCRTAGNPCGAANECCSNLCNNGICSSAVSFCVQTNEICSSNDQCCGGNCVKQSGNITGVCGEPTSGGGVPSGCKPSGTVCGQGVDAGTGDGGVFPCEADCCSRSCGNFGALSGFRVCQPPSGCRPTGEVCRADSDCCGWSGAPDPVKGPVSCSKATPTAEFGRCDNGGSCREPGSICKPGDGDSCSAENNCCEHSSLEANYCNNNPENCCKKDSLGIPRCLIKPVDCATAPPAGTVCATAADCCGNPCVNNKCGADGSCVAKGGECTVSADCCAPLPCVAPQGSSKGICGGTLLPDGGVSDSGTTQPPPPDGGPGNCALYGQLCNGAGDCCNGVPCTDGRCRLP